MVCDEFLFIFEKEGSAIKEAINFYKDNQNCDENCSTIFEQLKTTGHAEFLSNNGYYAFYLL